MVKASDNEFPSFLVKEGTTPASPAAGDQRTFIDSADHKFKRVNSSGTVTTIEGGTASSVTFVGTRVYNNASISVSNNTNTRLTFNSERFDSDAFHDTSTNSGRITVPSGKTGYYIFGCNVEWQSNASGRRQLWILLNNTTNIAFTEPIPANSAYGSINHHHSVVGMYNLSATDYIEAWVYQDSGGSLNIQSAANYSPEFWISLVGV